MTEGTFSNNVLSLSRPAGAINVDMSAVALKQDLTLGTNNNDMTLNESSAAIVKSVSGTVSNGNLKITVNGVESADIPLPESKSNEYSIYAHSAIKQEGEDYNLIAGCGYDGDSSSEKYNVSQISFSENTVISNNIFWSSNTKNVINKSGSIQERTADYKNTPNEYTWVYIGNGVFSIEEINKYTTIPSELYIRIRNVCLVHSGVIQIFNDGSEFIDVVIKYRGASSDATQIKYSKTIYNDSVTNFKVIASAQTVIDYIGEEDIGF